jgi:hypothetical protein
MTVGWVDGANAYCFWVFGGEIKGMSIPLAALDVLFSRPA